MFIIPFVEFITFVFILLGVSELYKKSIFRLLSILTNFSELWDETKYFLMFLILQFFFKKKSPVLSPCLGLRAS